jgi:phosphatidate cytidylyltransferase
MLIQRVIGSALWAFILWLVVFILPEWVFAFSIVVLIGLGLREFFDMVSKKGILVYKYFGIVTGCLIPVTTYVQVTPSAEMEFVLMTAVCLCVFLLQFTRRNTEQALVGIATTILGIFYVGWFFSFMIKLRVVPPMNMDGRMLILYLIIVTKSGDIGAYIIGSLFGKHQLIPRISPKKSVEGTVAGVVISFSTAVLFKGMLPAVSIANIIAIGAILSLTSQIGDLSESLIKRDCGVKDSGSFLPGLGGILDTIDSLIFTTPILYFYLKLIPIA